MAKGEKWFASQLKRHATKIVRYRRVSDSAIVDVAATAGQSSYEVTGGDHGMTRVQMRDFLITTTDLAIGGTAFLPSPGDTIEETLDDGVTKQTYRVAPPSDEDETPHFDYTGNHRQQLRIHTHQIS